MSDCSKHKKEVAGISDMKVLAEMIGDLHYETLSEFLCFLCDKLHNDSMKDYNANRMNLSITLHEAASDISNAQTNIEKAWQISKPFMKS